MQWETLPTVAADSSGEFIHLVSVFIGVHELPAVGFEYFLRKKVLPCRGERRKALR
ncbi:hypothetical protein [Parapedobacter koreensis]|uniref:hypothetical protein n=1 Tax=Parapedobacter koreensis TaxID=332977 RepID=UPI0015A6C7EF|nr:hypothetical protein [Parapedobacter koreensis]